MRLCIFGAGAMGTVLGAHLVRAGVSVDLVSRNRAHVEAMRLHGAKIVGKANFVQTVTAYLPDELSEPYNLIFLMTKQRDNANTAEFLKSILKEDGAICTLQNGLPEPVIAEVIGPNRTYGCAAVWGANLLQPGVAELTSDDLSFSLGAFGKDSGKLQEISSILSRMGRVYEEPNLIGARWAKLMINAAFSSLSVITGTTFGTVAKKFRSRKIALASLQECIEVAEAAKIRIAPLQGHDVAKLLGYKTACKRCFSFAILPLCMKHHRDLVSGMLLDLKRGRRTEIDYINGVVCAYGRKFGVATPYNDKAVELVHGIENGICESSFESLVFFEKL